MIQPVSGISTPQAIKNVSFGNTPAQTSQETPNDSVALSNEAPQIGFFRLAFKRLTPEQVAKVNETGKLPANAKFFPTQIADNYTIGNRMLNIAQGTRTLPEGTEVRRNWLGFTRVVPKDSETIFLKKK